MRLMIVTKIVTTESTRLGGTWTATAALAAVVAAQVTLIALPTARSDLKVRLSLQNLKEIKRVRRTRRSKRKRNAIGAR